MKIVSWSNLKAKIGSLKASQGNKSFERLVLRLFEAETGHPHYLAKSGNQPAGDVNCPNLGIAIQAKRYSGKKAPEAVRIEGDIDCILRENERTDLYVVATIKTSNQLEQLLEKKSNETGLSIIVLPLDENLTEFSALCVKHWQVLKEFFPNLDEQSEQWSKQTIEEEATKNILMRFSLRMEGIDTKISVNQVSKSWIETHVFQSPSNSHTLNTVNLSDSIPRPTFQNNLETWWKAPEKSLAVLQGEEGMGKTWITGAFVQSKFSAGETVFWLKSSSWASAKNVDDVLNIALRTIYPLTFSGIERMRRKVLSRWLRPTLIILDGVNEHEAWNAAEFIRQDFQDHQSQLAGSIKILFTSRPLDHRPRFGHHYWDFATPFKVTAFDKGEFTAAMEKFAPGLDGSAIRNNCGEIIAIPRYFRIWVRLIEDATLQHHVTKEILLWKDLLDKVSKNDPQWSGVHNLIGGNPEEILAALAKKVGWPNIESQTLASEELRAISPKFTEAISDLKDQRVVLQSNLEKAVLDRSHLVLGWAIFLKQIAVEKSLAGESPDVIQDSLQSVLEPGASLDLKVQAVHAATILIFSEDGATAGKIALLSLWISHHNAILTQQSLEYFLNTSLPAYIGTVEKIFIDFVSGNLESVVIAPLAKYWKGSQKHCELLTPYLEKWLRLIYPGDATGSKKRDTSPPDRFSKAQSQPQLRLSYVAVSIVSFNPVKEILPAIVDSYYSQSFCYEDYDGNHKQRFPIKDPSEGIGLLLRWHYQEEDLQQLKNLAQGVPSEGKEMENLLWTARLMRTLLIPKELGEHKDISIRDPFSKTKAFDDLRKWLKPVPNEKAMGPWRCHYAQISVRRDLPPLTEEEILILTEATEARVKILEKLENHQRSSSQDKLDDLLTCLAKYNPKSYHHFVNRLWLASLRSNPALPQIFSIQELLPATDPDGELSNEIVDSWHSIGEQKRADFMYPPLLEVALLHAPEPKLIQFLSKLENQSALPSFAPAVFLYPLPFALEILAPPGLSKFARAQIDDLVRQRVKDQKNDLHKLAHWLAIYTYCATPCPGDAKWAMNLLEHSESDSDVRFCVFLILLKESNRERFLEALSSPVFKEFHLGINSWRWGGAFPIGNWPNFKLKDLEKITSLTVAGHILSNSDNDGELIRWGKALSDHVFAVMNIEEPPPKAGGVTWVDETGKVDRYGFDLPSDGGSSFNSLGSGVWGVDRETNTPRRTQDDLDQACRDFKIDHEATKKSARVELLHFNAVGPLNHWSKIDKENFKKFAKEYLTRIETASFQSAFGFSFFSDAVRIALLNLDQKSPEKLLSTPPLERSTRVMTLRGAVPWKLSALWEQTLDASPEVQQLRKTQLLNANDDEELFWITAAAHASGNGGIIFEMGLAFLSDPLPRLRALGVSLLAFDGSSASLPLLDKLISNDTSYWVREHAEWGWNICTVEYGCRTRYGEILSATTLEEVGQGLGEIRMAMSPMAFAWRNQLETQELREKLPSRIKAYLDLFWYHWGNSSSKKSNITVGGRALKDFCRGDRHKEGIAGRMAPWWDISDETSSL